jgi:hypothetical protein
MLRILKQSKIKLSIICFQRKMGSSLSTVSFALPKAPPLINVVLDSVDIQAQRRQTLRLRLSIASQRSRLASISKPVQLWYLSNHNVLDNSTVF